MNQPLLTIAIPTYNRSGYLEQCLDSIIASISGYEHEVEIVISDNASIDNTEDMVSRTYLEYPFIHYFRNSDNIGAESNFFLAAQRGKGSYCLILGDDDKVEKKIIATILGLINSNGDLAAIVINSRIFDKSFSKVKVSAYHSYSNNKTYTNKNEIMLDFGPTLSFISSVVFKRDFVNSVNIKYYDFFKQYGFSFLFMVYELISFNSHVIYVSEPLILQRGDNSVVDVKKYFFIGLPKIFDVLSEFGYKDDALKKSKEVIFERYLKWHLLDMKLSNVDFDDEIVALTKSLIGSNKNKLLFFMLRIIPSRFFIFIKKIKNRLL